MNGALGSTPDRSTRISFSPSLLVLLVCIMRFKTTRKWPRDLLAKKGNFESDVLLSK